MSAAKAAGAGDYDAAIDLYKKSLIKDQKDIIALNMIALCYEWKGDLENAVQYANKSLAINPIDFDMLMLAARYWRKMNDDDKTYHYACRIIENPPEPFPSIPKWLFWVVKPLSLIFKGLRNIEERSTNDFAENERNNAKGVEWAKEFKIWYESKHGKQNHNERVVH